MSSRKLFLQFVSALALVAALNASAQSLNVIEYYNKTLDAHFITGRVNEQTALDGVADFRRTGMTFQATAVAGAPSSLTNICRFYVSLTTPYVSSHFYGRQGVDCESIRAQNVAGFTWEDYDFATQQPTAGACPTGTTPIFRGFRTAAGGKTSNHRYSASQATYDAAVAAGYVGEGAAFCATAATPATPTAGAVATAVGAPNGTPVSASIGAAGGTLASADGKLTLTVPAGALTANVSLSIQPITNFAHGKIGSAYRLTPDGQTFAQPVTLTFAYNDDDVLGSSADVLGAAFQTATGFWRWVDAPILNTIAKTVSVRSTHFSDWSRVKGIQMRPPAKAVRVTGSVGLLVTVCYQKSITDATGDELTYLGYNCDLGDELSILNPISDWSVNGLLGGSSVTGTVSGGGSTGTYLAPASKPNPNVVTVSARVKKSPLGEKVLVSSVITIVDDQWVGTGTSSSETYSVSAQVTWKLERIISNVATYSPSGTATMVLKGCIFYAPDNGVIEPNTGMLTVDYNTAPPTYRGVGVTVWPTLANTSNCPPLSPPSFNTFAPAVYFGGSKGSLGDEAQGQVSADGMTIEGADTNSSGAPVTFNWRFVRN